MITRVYTFCTSTLPDRKMVKVTLRRRKMLLQSLCGAEPMNCSSLMQRRRQTEKMGSRQPLKT